jgi:hypothetical protein
MGKGDEIAVRGLRQLVQRELHQIVGARDLVGERACHSLQRNRTG